MEAREIRRVQKFISTIRREEGDMTLQRLQVLLQMYLMEETDQTTLIRSIDLSKSATSKNIASWTELTALKKKGPGYLESTPDPMNLKTRIIKLTARGKAAIERFAQALM